MAIVRTIPQTTLPPAGTFGSAANIPANVNQITMLLQQISWPFAGDKAFDYTLDWSPDAGSTWQPIGGESVDDVPQTTVRGSIDNQFKINCTVPSVGSANRRVRVNWSNCKAGITISGTISTQVAS